MSHTLLYVTVGSLDEAKNIARKLVQERIVACANLLPGMTSIFYWEGKAQEEAEVSLLLKTRTELVATVTERVRALHSYSCPCVVALPITGGNPAFLEWIGDETRSSADS